MRTKPRFQDVFLPVGRDVFILVLLGLIFVFSATATLYVGMQQPTVAVPDVVGQRLGQAEAIARQASFALEVKARIYHDTAAVNTVVEQWPRAGTTVKQGQTLRVHLSLGPAGLAK